MTIPSFPQHLAEFLRDQWTHLKSHEPIARLGEDPIGVHQMRVATRRLRSVLSATKFLYPDDYTRTLREELKTLAAHLGAVRDLDVLLASLADRAPELSARLESSRQEAHQSLVAYLDSPSYLGLESNAKTQFAHPAPVKLSIAAAQSQFIPPVLASVLETGRSLDAKTAIDDQLHRFRIIVKKLRYLAELFSIEPLATASAALTGHLGQHQDVCIEIETLRSMESDSPALTDLLNQTRLHLRDTFPEVWQNLLAAAK